MSKSAHFTVTRFTSLPAWRPSRAREREAGMADAFVLVLTALLQRRRRAAWDFPLLLLPPRQAHLGRPTPLTTVRTRRPKVAMPRLNSQGHIYFWTNIRKSRQFILTGMLVFEKAILHCVSPGLKSWSRQLPIEVKLRLAGGREERSAYYECKCRRCGEWWSSHATNRKRPLAAGRRAPPPLDKVEGRVSGMVMKHAQRGHGHT